MSSVDSGWRVFDRCWQISMEEPIRVLRCERNALVKKTWALSLVPNFSLSSPRVAFSRVGWFSRALVFRSLYYPWGKMGNYSQSIACEQALCLWKGWKNREGRELKESLFRGYSPRLVLRTRFVLRVRCVRLAWLIKQLLCRLQGTWAMVTQPCSQGSLLPVRRSVEASRREPWQRVWWLPFLALSAYF